MNSFTTSENEKITTVRIPGSEIGKTMRISAWRREQPSISAASASSSGIVLKKPIRSQIENGTVKDRYTRNSDQSLSSGPTFETTRDSGRDRSAGPTT